MMNDVPFFLPVHLQRILDVCSVGANRNPWRSTSGGQSKTGSRDLFMNSSGRSSNVVSSRSKRRWHTLHRSAPQYGHLDTVHKHPTSHIQGSTYQGCDQGGFLSAEGLKTGIYKMKSLNMQGEAVFLCTANASFKLTRNKIQDLIVQYPNNYSQSSPATRMMLQAYGSKHIKNVTDYNWSEIFPVIRRSSRSPVCNDSGKSVSRFVPINPTQSSCISHSRRLKLPYIRNSCDSLGLDMTSTAQNNYKIESNNVPLSSIQGCISDRRKLVKASEVVNAFEQPDGEAFQSASSGTEERVDRYMHHKDGNVNDTGLVVKLPQIANLRIAAQNS